MDVTKVKNYADIFTMYGAHKMMASELTIDGADDDLIKHHEKQAMLFEQCYSELYADCKGNKSTLTTSQVKAKVYKYFPDKIEHLMYCCYVKYPQHPDSDMGEMLTCWIHDKESNLLNWEKMS